MGLGPKALIYVAAAAAVVIGIAAYSMSAGEHDEEGLIEGDFVKVAAVGTVLAIVAIASFAYLARTPEEEG